MALPEWPASLPTKPVIDGTGPQTLFSAPLRTEVEDGPIRQRRRSVANWVTINLRFRLTNTQYLTFETFVRDTLGHGSSRFRMPVWKPGAVEPLPLRVVQIEGDLPAPDTMGNFNFVTLPLRVRDY